MCRPSSAGRFFWICISVNELLWKQFRELRHWHFLYRCANIMRQPALVRFAQWVFFVERTLRETSRQQRVYKENIKTANAHLLMCWSQRRKQHPTHTRTVFDLFMLHAHSRYQPIKSYFETMMIQGQVFSMAKHRSVFTVRNIKKKKACV